ncbi:MAG: hypothetical protein Q9195_005273 [Heterodermia aff. obscurata]
MFTTFAADPLHQEDHVTASNSPTNSSTQKRQAQHDHQTLARLNSPISASDGAAVIPRPKRSQVARACEWCRMNRIKCDDKQPCHACRSRGAECSNAGKSGLRSLPTATKQVILSAFASSSRCPLTIPREIERLEARVKELESELNDSRKNKGLLTPQATPQDNPSPFMAPPSSSLDPMESHQGNQRQWQGIWTSAYPSREPCFFGPTSVSYFIAALRSYITSSLQLSHSDFQMEPSRARDFLVNPTISRTHSAEEGTTLPEEYEEGECILSRAREESFLALFWQSYHCTIPILTEVGFREHYESLWTLPAPPIGRKASPLVDIILALCMQYGMTFVPPNHSQPNFMVEFDSEDSSIAGRTLYRRCQNLLSTMLETPTIMTLQCQIFSSVYLNNASFVNLSHSNVALGIRTAHILGLNQKSRSHSSRAEKELQQRLWWVVYSMESNASMTTGRPSLVQMSQVSCALPADDRELAQLSGPSFASSMKDITWLSYHVHHVRLVLAARATHVAFGNRCTQVLNASGQEHFHGNAQNTEALAGFLAQNLQGLRTWVRNIPDELKTERRDGGNPYTTDRSAIQMDLEAPQWLQRQRLLLELTYHDLMMNLYRPFITFAKAPSSSMPLANSHNISCLNHAITITNFMLQMLKSSDILNGWYEAYRLQWKAALTMVGFIFANPVCPPTPTARRTINGAIEVFDILRNNFAIAGSAANATRNLAAKADAFLDLFRTGSASAQQQNPATKPASLPTTSMFQGFISNNSSGSSKSNPFHMNRDGDSAMDQAAFSGSMGEGLPMDPFVGSEWPSPVTGAENPEMWSSLLGGGE